MELSACAHSFCSAVRACLRYRYRYRYHYHYRLASSC
jgi:hypothetical protein